MTAPHTSDTPTAEAAAAFGQTVAAVLRDVGGNARTVEEMDSVIELRGESRLLQQHRSRLAETGLPGLLAPEDAGGLGLLEEGSAVRAIAAVARAAGTVPGPDLAGSWAAAPLILHLAQADPALQSRVASGDETLAVVDLRHTSSGDSSDEVLVIEAETADGILVLEDSRIRLVRDVPLMRVPSFDPTRPVSRIPRAALTGEGTSFDEVTPFSAAAPASAATPPAQTLAEGPEADRIADLARAAGRLVLAAELHGTGQELLRLVVEHLSTRMAFGRPLGTFQALKHRVADLWSELSLVGSLVDEAARLLDAALASTSQPSGAPESATSEAQPTGASASQPSEAPAYAAAALSLAADTVVHGGEEVLQLHGGLGFTWESPVHVLLKRAIASRVRWGAPHELRREVAAQFDL
jgi:alkylation response protein AidB-like acyl-CoA dehydrogenase